MPGIYVHIPFCVQKCSYCDFVSFADRSDVAVYMRALAREIQLWSDRLQDAMRFDTVFIGGGTPSVLPGGHVQRLLRALNDGFCIEPGAEISIECNPGTLTREQLEAYRGTGVNRLSIGLQSASDALLCRIGRIHTCAEFLQAVRDARLAGFSNLNVDVMHGLPGQRVDDYLQTLECVCGLHVEHVSAYALILEEHTPLYGAVQRGDVSLPPEDDVWDMQDAGIAYLEERGYARYEISNFARPGYRCRHNCNYWRNGAYLGLGLNAHSAMHTPAWTRWENTANLGDYLRALDSGALPIVNKQRISGEEERFESVMLALRMVEGLDLRAFANRFGQAFEQCYPDAVQRLTACGFLQIQDGFARLNRRGLDVQNEALLAFL